MNTLKENINKLFRGYFGLVVEDISKAIKKMTHKGYKKFLPTSIGVPHLTKITPSLNMCLCKCTMQLMFSFNQTWTKVFEQKGLSVFS